MPETGRHMTSTLQSMPSSPGTTFFFAVALGFTLLLQLPAALAQLGLLPGGAQSYMGLAALGMFGPLVAALLAARRESGRDGMRALRRAIFRFDAPLVWYAVALLACLVVHAVGTALYRGLGGGAEVRFLYLPENAQHWVSLVLVPLVEEPGWRGFALPRLLRAHSPLSASLRLGLVWALWHVAMFVVQGMGPAAFALGLLNIVAGSVLFSWLYARSGGSLTVAIVAHAGAHLNNPTRSLQDGLTPFAVYTAALCVTALLLPLLDRPAFAADRVEAWMGAGPSS
jgi:membrane protease YdiL (CAAX protease family)